MDAKRAAEVLLKNKDVRVLRAHSVEVEEATDLGAQALEAWAWVTEAGVIPERLGEGWIITRYRFALACINGFGPTPLASVLDAMEKEGKG